MGKAILILNLPSKYDEDIKNGRVMIDYSLLHLDHKFKAEQNFHNATLKPMPKKEEIPIDAEIMYSWYLKGYNECLRLLGGEEE